MTNTLNEYAIGNLIVSFHLPMTRTEVFELATTRTIKQLGQCDLADFDYAYTMAAAKGVFHRGLTPEDVTVLRGELAD